jgi:hypothetical protein
MRGDSEDLAAGDLAGVGQEIVLDLADGTQFLKGNKGLDQEEES